MNVRRFTASMAVAALGVVIYAEANQNAQPKTATPENKHAVAKAAKPIADEMVKLKDQAKTITKEIGKIASSDDLTTNEESVKTLQSLVKELSEINEKLTKLQEQINEINGWIEGQNENLPVMANDLEILKKISWGNYIQFQWADTQQGKDSSGKDLATNDGFQLRRFRISTTNRIDPKTSMKLAFDVAAGSQRETAELKEAILMYDIVPSTKKFGTVASAGQMAFPLGFELERSSSEREFPEYSLYNRTLFNGEDGRGINLKHGLTQNVLVQAGIWNSLTYNDPQQTDANNFKNLNSTHLATTAGVRYFGNHFDVGVSGLLGKRPAVGAKTTTTWTDKNGNGTIDSGEVSNSVVPAVAAVDRQLIYLDGTYVGFLVPNLTLRAEYMAGKDRVPTLSNGVPKFLTQSNLEGWQAQLSYKINYRNTLSLRYEQFDPNTATGNNSVDTYGLAYTYWLNPGAKLTLSHEIVNESGFESRNDVTTIRLQFKL